MIEGMNEYILSLGLSSEITKRVALIIDQYTVLCGLEPSDVFISDFIKQDGARDFGSLWLFSSDYACEAKEFFTTDNFDLAPIRESVGYWKTEKKDFDLKETSEKSRFALTVRLASDITCSLQASGANCSKLLSVFLKYFRPNL